MATKLALGVVLASALALLTACGGGGDTSPLITSPPPVMDTTPPRVLAEKVTPAPGATVTQRSLSTTVPFSEPLTCWSGDQAFADQGITGTIACKGDTVTVKFDDAALSNKVSVTATLSKVTDLSGNAMAPYSWTYQLQADAATVSLTATPNPITVGSSTSLAWVTQNAASCLGSGGLSGSLNPAGGSVTVTPTITTSYGVQCWNSANVTTGVVTTTVTVNPAPVKLEYQDVVIAIWNRFPDWPRDTSNLVRIDRHQSSGYLPNTNSTGKQFYFTGIRATPRTDCLLEASALDNVTGVEYKLLYNPKTGEFTLDTSAAGAALNRSTDYQWNTYVFDPVYPLWAGHATVSDGMYYILDTEHENLYFRSNTGVVTQVVKSTFATTGGINGIWTYSCKAR